MLVTLLGRVLVAGEETLRTLGELAGQAAVTGLVHQELLITAGGRLGVQRELLLALGVVAEQVPVAALDSFFISFWQFIMPPLMLCISQGL